MHRSKRTRTRHSSIPVPQSGTTLKNEQTQKTIYTTRSDSSDGEITTVRQSFEIIGTIDGDNRNSVESFCDSNKDSGYNGSQDLLNQDNGSDSNSEVEMIKTISFEDVDTRNDSQIWTQPTNDIKLELEEEVGEDEEALKEELLRIFDREKLTLGSFFKHKMTDMTKEFKNKQITMEENSRAERANLENEIAQEREQMQKSFADEIAELTHTFNGERASLEQYYKDQLKELREQYSLEQDEMDQQIAREKSELGEKMEAEFQAMLRAEMADLRQFTMQEATDREERHSKEKLEMGRKYNVELTEAEINTQKIKSELEMMFAQERMRLERDMRETTNELEAQLREEKEKRNELEKLFEQEKVNAGRLESEKTNESERIKSELDGLRIELDIRNKSSMEVRKVEEEIRVKGKDGLNGKLREDFDQIVKDYKTELDRNYQKEKEHLQGELEYQCQVEKQRVQEDLERERKKLNEAMAIEREDLEKRREKFQEEKEDKAKEDEGFSRENNLEYEENYRSRGVQQSDRGENAQECYKFERHIDIYQPSLNSTRENSDEYSPRGRNSENVVGYDTEKYPSSYSKQSGKIQVQYESPTGSESNEPRYASNNQPFVSVEKGEFPSSFDSEAASKKDLFYVTPENENKLRSDINELRRENEGLKAQIAAMDENIDLHKTYKAEAKEEISRLQKDKNELQSKLKNKDTEQDDAIRARNNTYELEKTFRESEAQRHEFEEKIKELNERLREAENKSQLEKERVRQLEVKLNKGQNGRQRAPKRQSPTMQGGINDPLEKKDSMEACYSTPTYQIPSTSLQYSKELEDDQEKHPNNEPSLCKPESQDNVYGYPSETKSKEYKRPHCGESYRSIDAAKCDYSDRFGSDTEYPRVTRPDLYSSQRTTSPLYGSHNSPSTRFASRREPCKATEKYKPGKYSNFGEKSDPYFETSSPRTLKTDRRHKLQSLDPKDHMPDTKKTNYEKAVAEREKLVQMIKELKERAQELEKEKERIDNEEYELKGGQYDNFSTSSLPDENAALKLKVDEMQRKIRVLADRLKTEKSKNTFEDEQPKRKPYSMEEIEDLQGKLQRTGDVISGSNDNLDPDVLRRIEKEINSIGEFIRSHYYEESHGGSSYRSANGGGKVLQLQMEKQELEMKLNMAKEAMNDYVGRLNDKKEDLQETNCLSDSTLQEIYDRNASLKDTLRALEKGQHKSQMQNEQLKHQKSALQNLIGQLCKPSDASFGSQYSSPRHPGKDGNYGCTMTSQVHYRTPKHGSSERYGS